jgi:hypothetical protein
MNWEEIRPYVMAQLEQMKEVGPYGVPWLASYQLGLATAAQMDQEGRPHFPVGGKNSGVEFSLSGLIARMLASMDEVEVMQLDNNAPGTVTFGRVGTAEQTEASDSTIRLFRLRRPGR